MILFGVIYSFYTRNEILQTKLDNKDKIYEERFIQQEIHCAQDREKLVASFNHKMDSLNIATNDKVSKIYIEFNNKFVQLNSKVVHVKNDYKQLKNE